jgi:hypothetical protein
VTLYAEDAIRYGHDGQIQVGRTAIAEFYRSYPPVSRPYAEVECLLVNGPFIGALLRLPADSHRGGWCLNIFEIDETGIRSLRVLLEKSASDLP